MVDLAQCQSLAGFYLLLYASYNPSGDQTMYKNILVPVVFDGENNAQASFSAARALAGEDAVLTLVHVLEDIPAYVSVQIPNDVLAATRREIEGSLNQLAESLPGAKTQLISGHAGRSIVDYADANEVDCIIVA